MPASAIEGKVLPLEEVFPDIFTSDDEKRVRSQIGRISGKIRRELRLREEPLVITEGDNLGIRFRGIAGTIRIGRVEVEVSPKHAEYDYTSDADWRAGLMVMLERSAPRRVAFSRSRQLQFRQSSFLDQFAHTFAVELAKAGEGPAIRQYRSIRQESRFLRGRLVLSDQLRGSLSRPDVLICEVDFLDTDNPQNQLLRWVASVLKQRVRDSNVRRLLSDQLVKLPVMAGPPRAPSQLNITVPRQYAHYSGALQLAAAYAQGRSTYPGLANIDGSTLVAGTEKLFESFLEKSLIAVAAGQRDNEWTVRAQATEVFATGIGHTRTFYSKPDNVLDIHLQPKMIIDAKYKKFSEASDVVAGSKPSNSDLYQMAAACVAHRVDRALLIYPQLVTDPEAPTAWSIRWWKIKGAHGQGLIVGAAAVDLSMLGNPEALVLFDKKLEKLIQKALLQENSDLNSGPIEGNTDE